MSTKLAGVREAYRILAQRGAAYIDACYSIHPKCHEFEFLDNVETCLICGAVRLPPRRREEAQSE